MAKKTAKLEVTADQSATESSADKPVDVPAGDLPADSTAPKPVDLTAPAIQEAIAQGKSLLSDGKSKADAARAIYAALKDESKEVIVAAFIEGATLTPKGALTYWYNCRRKAAKESSQV